MAAPGSRWSTAMLLNWPQTVVHKPTVMSKEPDFSPQESVEVTNRVETRVFVGGQRNANVTHTSAHYVSRKQFLPYQLFFNLII